MKILLAVLVVILLGAAGVTLYAYKKKAIFLPALFGLCGFPKVKKSSYYDENGRFRQATAEDKIGFFMQHPIFGGYKHMFYNVEDNVLKAIAPAKCRYFFQAQGAPEQVETVVEAFNYLVGLVEKGQAELVKGIHTRGEVKDRPFADHLTGMFYRGRQGMPLAVVVPGGGFISNATAYEGYPVAMKLHQMGYSAFVVSYPIGNQLGETDQRKRGQAAARELTQVIRYLTEHQQELSINMEDYAIFGFSAGGLMTTAYSFANYEDCCHKNHLPRPRVIFPVYGLDWDIKALPEDKGLAVFSIVGRDDEYGFANVEDKLPQLEKMLGKENVSVRIVDGLGHGFGLGNETKVKNWLLEAAAFWEAHR